MPYLQFPGRELFNRRRIKPGISKALIAFIFTGVAATAPVSSQLPMGLPTWMWVATYHPGDCCYQNNWLPWGAQYFSGSTALKFRQSVGNQITSLYPGVSVSTQDFLTSNFNYSAFQSNGSSTLYEMVFVYSHGSSYGTLATWNQNHRFSLLNFPSVPLAELSRYTKYLMLYSCLTLYNSSPAQYAVSMKGVHAIAGTRSNIKAINYSPERRVDRIGEYFALYYVTYDEIIWNAWRDAIRMVQYEFGTAGVEPAMVFNAGIAEGSFFSAKNERLAHMYDGAVFRSQSDMDLYPHAGIVLTSNGLITAGLYFISEVYGQPDYSSTIN